MILLSMDTWDGGMRDRVSFACWRRAAFVWLIVGSFEQNSR